MGNNLCSSCNCAEKDTEFVREDKNIDTSARTGRGGMHPRVITEFVSIDEDYYRHNEKKVVLCQAYVRMGRLSAQPAPRIVLTLCS